MTAPFRENRKTWERLASRQLLEHAIQHDGVRRTALLYVPRHMLDRGKLPLVLVFHGGASDPEAIAKMSAMHRIAEREGFIVAYPAGTKGRSGLTWRPAGKDAARKTGDARFVRDLIVDLRRCYEINPARVFAAGFSVGGSLVYELACLMADRIAAAAVVAGTMTTSHCDPARPVPLIHIHGTADRRVPFEGGRGPTTSGTNNWAPVRDGIDRWRAINGCGGAPKVVRLGLEGVTGYLYAGTAKVELWLVEGGGHAWPGGKRDAARGEDSPGQDGGFAASEKIWSFFAAHTRGRLPPRAPPTAGDATQPDAASA